MALFFKSQTSSDPPKLGSFLKPSSIMCPPWLRSVKTALNWVRFSKSLPFLPSAALQNQIGFVLRNLLPHASHGFEAQKAPIAPNLEY